MKVFNIVFGSIALVILGVHGGCLLSNYLEVPPLAIIPAIALGLYSRRIVEKFFGYTLDQAVKETSDEK